MPYDIIEKAIEQQKIKREKRRIQKLSQLQDILSEMSQKYGFSQAYIFGSVTKEGKFGNQSDIDIAVFGLKNDFFFSMMAEISRKIDCEVDLYQIEKIDEYMKKKIEETGILWKQEKKKS